MKKMSLNKVFESLIKGDSKKARDMFHSYTIMEGVKINRKLKESEDFDDATDGKSGECSISICLNDSDVTSDEISEIFDEIFSDLEIEADVVLDDEDNKFTLTFDTEDEADNFISELTDRVNSLEIDDIEIDNDEETLDEAMLKEFKENEIVLEVSSSDRHITRLNEDEIAEAAFSGKVSYKKTEEEDGKIYVYFTVLENLTDRDIKDAIDYIKEEMRINSVKIVKTLDEANSYDDYFLSAEEEKAIQNTVDDFDVEEFLKEYGSDFLWDERDTLEDDEKVIDKSDIIDALSHYLYNYSSRFFDDNNTLSVEDFKEEAEELFDEEVKDFIEDAGYTFNLNEGEDLGKPGKNFDKIAKSAAKEYGSKEAGERVAGAVLAKLRKEHPRKYSEKKLKEADMADNQSPIDIARRMGYDEAKNGNTKRFNSNLRSLMNDQPGDKQRRKVYDAYLQGMDDYKEGRKISESAEDSYELKLTFPSDGDSFIVDKLEDKMEKRKYDFDVVYNDIDDNGIRIFTVKFESKEECDEAKEMFEDFLDAMDVEDFDLKINEESEELTESEEDFIDIDDCEDDDKLDLILAKISDLEDQIDSLSDISNEAEETALDDAEDEMEEELPELTESYFQKEEDELMSFLNKGKNKVKESKRKRRVKEAFKLEPVDTKKYINKDLKDDESPFSELDLLKLDLSKHGIENPSVDNAKGYDWKKPSFKDVNSVVKGDIRNKEQKLEKVNPYNKDSILNRPYGKENDMSPMSKIKESKRRVLRKRK